MTEENVRLDLPSPRSWRYVLGYALIVVVASIFVHILWRHWDLALRLVRISPYALSVVALVVTINLLARADYLRQLVRDLGAPVPARECFLLLGTTHMLSMVTLPGAGAAYRVSYLSRQYDVKTLPFANGTALFVIVGVLVWCVLGTAALVACGLDVGNIRSRLLLVTLVLATGLVAVRPAYQVLCLTSNRRLRCIGRLADECFQVSWSRSLRVAVAVALCCAAAQVAGFYLVFRSFSLPIGLMATISIVACHQLSGIVGVTPGAVGVQEGVGVVVSAGLGVDVAQMVVVLALIRVARIGMSILVGVPCWWLLPKEKSALVQQQSDP